MIDEKNDTDAMHPELTFEVMYFLYSGEWGGAMLRMALMHHQAGF